MDVCRSFSPWLFLQSFPARQCPKERGDSLHFMLLVYFCLLIAPPFSFFFFLNSPLHKNIVLLAIDKALLLNNSTAICSQHSPLLLCLCCDVISHENKLNCWNFPDHTFFLSFLHISLHFLCTCQETIVNFAKRCGQIIDLAIKWAPDETKAILEVHTYLGPAD